MPTINIRRFPLPSVSIYLILSASLLMLAIMWANNTLVEEQEFLDGKSQKGGNLDGNQYESDNRSPHERQLQETIKKKARTEIWSYPTPKIDGSRPQSSITFSVKRDTNNAQDGDGPFIATEIAKAIANGEYSFSYGVLTLMLDEPLCLMLVVNATYCVLIIFMHVIQKIVFGRLRPIERQHIKDKFWNFVFYKFIFIFGVMNVQSLNEVLIWVSWFTAIAFLLLLTKLSKDRFEFLSFSPNTPMFYHWKVVGLLLFILFFCVLLGISCVVKGFPFSSFSVEYYDIHSTTFMLAEAVIIAIKAIHVLMRYSIHLYDIQHTELWERKATLVYHVDLIMELLSLLVNFVHHLHMLFSGNIWLSMASLVICMQLRFIFSEIQKRYLRHKNYRRVVANMDAQFPAATPEELTQHEDRCAICWDQMETARKLPCGHLFHSACLRSWLEQDTTCPTCRKQLGIRQNSQEQVIENAADPNEAGANLIPGGVAPPAGDVLTPTAAAGGAGPQRNHFWHFDGSRIASWLPSFSVEVTHSLRGRQNRNHIDEEMSNSQLDSMVRDVHEIFPQIPSRLIANDLRMTGSVEATTNNILEGNIVVPPDQMLPSSQSSSERQSDFQIPVTTRSLPIMGSTTVRRRHLASMSDSVLSDRTYTNLPSTPSTETILSTVTDDSSTSIDTSSINENVSSNAPPSPTYGHFSKAPEERETILQSRRDIMVRQARLKYLNRTLLKKPATEPSVTRSAETCMSESSEGQRSSGHVPSDLAHASSQPSIRLRHVALNPSEPSDTERASRENETNEGIENSSVG